MSIVSAKIDMYRGGGRTFMNRDIAPQRRARDFGEAEVPEFMMAETTNAQSQSLKIRRDGNTSTNHSLSYVPLKCDQYGSHAVGASLFNAPVHEDVAQLKIPQEYTRHPDAAEMYAETEIGIAPPMFLKRGIRPEPRYIKFSQVAEPAEKMFKPEYAGAGASNYSMPKVSYDVGNAELLRLYGRT